MSSIPAESASGTAVQQLSQRRSRLPQRRFAIGGLIIIAAVAYLVFSSFNSAVSSVVSPTQLMSRGSAAYGLTLRLQGRVVGADTLNKTTLANTFRVSDGRNAVMVAYASDLPGGFKTGAQVEAQGTFDGREFMASSLTAKCPTKYVAASQ